MSNNETVTLDFSAKVVTNLGEQVFVAGNISQLGLWNNANALKLYTNKDIYPQWKNRKPIAILKNTSLEFKIFIKNAQGIIRWQKIQGNRKFVPTQSVLINLEQSSNQMTYQPIITEEQEAAIHTPPNRKKTFDIIRDLSDQISQSSSGNERQFWLEKRKKERSTISSSKQFVADAKLIFQTWTHERSKIKQRFSHQWTQLIPSRHWIVTNQSSTHKGFLDQNPFKNQLHKHSIAFVESANIQKQTYTQINQTYDNALKIFHVEATSDTDRGCASDIMKKAKSKYEGYWVVYLFQPQVVIDEYLLQNAEMLVANNKKSLKEIIQKFHIRKNHSVSMLKQNQFLIKKDNNKSVIVLYDPKINILDLQFAQNADYFSGLQKNLLNQKNFLLPQNLRISYLIQKNIVHEVHKHRFCISILCQKLQQISQKIITKLIRISSYRNISINIMTADQIPQIFKKLPVSENDKLLAYNRNGEVFKPGKKPASIYEETKISHKKYEEVFNILKNKAKFWIQNRQVQVVENPHSLQFICERDALGEALSESLNHQFSKCQDFHYPYQIEKYVSENKKQIVIHIRPVLSSTQFYARIITSINMFPPQNTYFLSFDFTNDKYKFIEKMGRAAAQKRAISQGFVMANTSNQNGLKQQKFQQFLSFILSQACYSIIQQDLDKLNKPGGKKDKEAIRSDFIN